MLVFRPAGHLVKNSDLGLGPRDLHFSYPPIHMEIPHPSASGKRQWGLLWLRLQEQGCGAQQPEGGPFQVWQLVGWQLESGGCLGAAGRAGGVANLAQLASGQSPLRQHPWALALLPNGPWLLSLICGVACNNKMLLKAGTWHE